MQIGHVIHKIDYWYESRTEVIPDATIDVARFLPPPQVTWTLLGLMRYRRRQKWAQNLCRKRLASQLRWAMNRVDCRDTLSSTVRGFVPGMPKWNYRLNPFGSCLTNRVSGEEIHFEIVESLENIKLCHFYRYFMSLRHPGPAERRMQELFPHGHGLEIGVDYLCSREVLRREIAPRNYFWAFAFCDEFGDDFDVTCLKAFWTAWAESDKRLLLSSLIGDWPAVQGAAEAVGQSELATRASDLAVRSSQRWLNFARVAADDGMDDALYVLGEAKTDDLPEYLEAALICKSRTAIEIIGDDAGWLGQVEAIRKNSLTSVYSCVWPAAAAYLAKHGYPVAELLDDVPDKISRIAPAISLAIDYLPARLGDLLNYGLRSSNFEDRLRAAAVLALIDNDWSRRQLWAALESSSERDVTIECRCALRQNSDPLAARAVDDWEQEHPKSVNSDYFTELESYDYDARPKPSVIF